MNIRLSQIEDIPAIMAIYDVARQFMKDQGNPTQWDGGYPSASLIEDDIAAGHSFVVEEEEQLVGTFAFIIGEDPTYQVIEREPGILRSLTVPFIASLQMAKSEAYPVRSLIFAASRFPTCESIPMRTISLCRQLC